MPTNNKNIKITNTNNSYSNVLSYYGYVNDGTGNKNSNSNKNKIKSSKSKRINST